MTKSDLPSKMEEITPTEEDADKKRLLEQKKSRNYTALTGRNFQQTKKKTARYRQEKSAI